MTCTQAKQVSIGILALSLRMRLVDAKICVDRYLNSVNVSNLPMQAVYAEVAWLIADVDPFLIPFFRLTHEAVTIPGIGPGREYTAICLQAYPGGNKLPLYR